MLSLNAFDAIWVTGKLSIVSGMIKASKTTPSFNPVIITDVAFLVYVKTHVFRPTPHTQTASLPCSLA